MTPRAAVVIVNYGASAILEPNAATVQPPGDGFVVVVDCFSSTDERARIDAACRRHGWVPVLLERNAGFGGGTNAGAALALERGAEVVVALNPDATIDREMSERLLAGLVEMAEVLVASGHYKPAVEVPDDAPIETKLIAASGRNPDWKP